MGGCDKSNAVVALGIKIIHNLLRLKPPGLPSSVKRQQTRQMVTRAGLRDRRVHYRAR